MLNKIKVFLLRWIYRLMSAWAWRGWKSNAAHSVLQIPTPAGPIALRMYANERGADKPLIVYFHGGGWVIGDLVTHHPFCEVLGSQSGCTLISVDYRLAPEHPYPAAHDDCLEASRWVISKLAELGPNNGTVILAGDSAGANLATCTCLSLKAEERGKVAGEIVIYPVTNHYSSPSPSYLEKASGYALSSNLMRWFWDVYLSNGSGDYPRRTTPLQADNLASLPPTLLVTAEHDPLRDEGVAYGESLRASVVLVQHKHFEQEQHGFACSQGPTPSFKTLTIDIVNWIKNLN